MKIVTRLLLTIALIHGALLGSIILHARQMTPAAGMPHGSDTKNLVNPLESNAETIAAGRKLYEEHCLECHGDEGKGDGMAGEDLDPPPADLTDGEWKHGESDGEIFVVIRDGTDDGMKKFGRKLTTTGIWQVVTYLRGLGPKKDLRP